MGIRNPKLQKFRRGDLVHITKDMPSYMSHFVANLADAARALNEDPVEAELNALASGGSATTEDDPMKTCETCKYWKPQEEGFKDLGEGNAWCEMAQNHYDFGGRAHPESLSRAEDGENYMAGLVTHKSFGCIQWHQAAFVSPANPTKSR